MKGTFLCVGTMKSAQKGNTTLTLSQKPHGCRWTFLSMVKQGQGIQLALNFSELSFIDIAFEILLICNGGIKILLVITQLSHRYKVYYRLSVMHKCFVQKMNLSFTFKKDWSPDNSDPTLPNFSISLMAKHWAHDSCTSHDLKGSTSLLQHNFCFFFLLFFDLLEFPAM